MRAYYSKFERHAHGEGIKAHSTHYCAGCGHGLAHNYMAEAIDQLGIQDRTVAISPVGCSVFMYYYLDVGNTQAAHGRAPVVALGHKVANPKSVVITYQGDGDLGSIGLAEIMHVAQLGLPMTFIFINNAIYGMTGGQMAPTTLMGQKTQTTPDGRTRLNGQPMKIAELIAQLDGPIYVERVALFDAVQRNKAKRAINKAIKLQVENKGFSFVEVLSECPTHWKVSARESTEWVKKYMLPIYPLGIKKEFKEEPKEGEPKEFVPWFDLKTPQFDPETLLGLVGASAEKSAVGGATKYCASFPAHIDPADISLKLAGSGGDGAQTAAMLITQAAINEGFDSTHIPSYGPESRGGTSYADVHVASEKVYSPSSPHPHILVAFNAPSLNKFGPLVVAGGTIIYDSSVVNEVPAGLAANVKVYGVPFTSIAAELGKTLVKNVVALGALQAATGIFPAETFLLVLKNALASKSALYPLNEAAFKRGLESVMQQNRSTK